MNLDAVAQWFAFATFALIALAGALGMATTMSMFRSGIFLMGSFIGVAGLFILLSADLIALLQVMMYIGGMLVMILFMVLFAHDPGGSMMAGMKMPPIEKFFSLGIKPMEMNHGGHQDHEEHDDEEESEGANGHEHHEEGHGHEGGGHQMDMSMTTPVKPHAVVLALCLGAGLIALIILRPAWPISDQIPNPASAREVGSLLMDKYMMAFEGAALLILIGIFGAVLLARVAAHPDRSDRKVDVAVDEKPPPIEEEPVSAAAPLPAQTEEDEEEEPVGNVHREKT